MKKKEGTRWDLGCFDSFESPFLKELHRIRTEQAKKTKGLSPNDMVKYIKSQIKEIGKRKDETN